jgi:hypothetical protein
MIRASVSECLPNPDPLARPDYTEAECAALRANWGGSANPRQQKMAFEYMLRAFGTHDTSFRPDDPYLTAFAEGRRHAGTTLVWMLKAAPSRIDPDKVAVRMIGGRSEEQG